MSRFLRAYSIRDLILITLISIHITAGLKCRTDDGINEAELKRVTRKCMKKMSENFHAGHLGIPTRNQNFEQRKEANYDDYDYLENSNNNQNRNNYNYAKNTEHSAYDEILRPRSRNSFSGRNGRNEQHNTDNRNPNIRNPNSGNSNNSQRLGGGSHDNNNYGNFNNGNYKNNSKDDVKCVVHCFFDEMNMLNNNNYPDKQKVMFMLTKNMRERDLRNFYTESIQMCFLYLENRNRLDKCEFSHELVNCLAEYGKANCDDWNDSSLIFN
ncbi:odorant-binding protein 59a-like [Teleopsis dalmanni]|uniref:odorant-binding protein 59a-like n=1 Tax=Teleopsis dalmanni TaxID=139649 RepID=UPI0018CE2786|nr:odorant-binding protein 59a-like [Teleopsis dalmanni]